MLRTVLLILAALAAVPATAGAQAAASPRDYQLRMLEHQRKFLIEIDPEGTFGSDVLTAPQVIGDDEYEDD